MKQIKIILIAVGISAACSVCMGNWPQAGANASRTAYVDTQPNPPYELIWDASWKGETITPQTSPIAFDDTVYVGTEKGIVHAIDIANGKDRWARKLPAPIINSLACDKKLVYAACLDGSIRALHRKNGKIEWESAISRRGFSASPMLMDGSLFAGSRDGVFYSVNAENGKLRWRFEADGPVNHAAAGADGKLVFVTDMMTAWCLDIDSGKPVWKHKSLPGSRPGYWPTIHKGRVVIVMPGMGRPSDLQQKLFWPVQYNLPVETVHYKAKTVKDMVTGEQDIFVKHFRENPDQLRVFVYNLSDGTRPYTPGLVRGSSENGEPLVLGGDGRLYSVFRTSAAKRGLMNITRCAIGHFNIETGRLDEPVVAGDFELTKIVGIRSPFELTSDEPVSMAGGGNLLFGSRSNAGVGAIDISAGKSYSMPDKALPRAHDMHPGPALPVISGKYVLHTKLNHILCIRGR